MFFPLMLVKVYFLAVFLNISMETSSGGDLKVEVMVMVELRDIGLGGRAITFYFWWSSG